VLRALQWYALPSPSHPEEQDVDGFFDFLPHLFGHQSEWKKNGEVALVLIGTWYRSEAVRLKSKIEVEKGE
jgi:hypothetical protein